MRPAEQLRGLHIHISMKGWTTSVQQPGLMKMSLMHQLSLISSGAIIKGTQHLNTIHDIVCHPHNLMLPHEQLHHVLAGLNKTGHQSHIVHGRAFKHKLPLIMMSMQIAPFTSAGPGEARCTGPTQQALMCPHRKMQPARMQQSLRGRINRAPGCHNQAATTWAAASCCPTPGTWASQWGMLPDSHSPGYNLHTVVRRSLCGAS